MELWSPQEDGLLLVRNTFLELRCEVPLRRSARSLPPHFVFSCWSTAKTKAAAVAAADDHLKRRRRRPISKKKEEARRLAEEERLLSAAMARAEEEKATTTAAAQPPSRGGRLRVRGAQLMRDLPTLKRLQFKMELQRLAQHLTEQELDALHLRRAAPVSFFGCDEEVTLAFLEEVTKKPRQDIERGLLCRMSGVLMEIKLRGGCLATRQDVDAALASFESCREAAVLVLAEWDPVPPAMQLLLRALSSKRRRHLVLAVGTEDCVDDVREATGARRVARWLPGEDAPPEVVTFLSG
jgi:hypothetical protein